MANIIYLAVFILAFPFPQIPQARMESIVTRKSYSAHVTLRWSAVAAHIESHSIGTGMLPDSSSKCDPNLMTPEMSPGPVKDIAINVLVARVIFPRLAQSGRMVIYVNHGN